MVQSREAIWSNVRDEPVEVNQRALIDKVLARYSGKFTVFRELLQNSDDAQSSAVEIHFETAAYLRRKDGTQGNVNELLSHDLRSALVVQWTFRNNGIAFTNTDWTRLRKIAEGNPNEDKIGAFGVGFYSLFSVTENPFVSSGGHVMQFYWKDDKDQLNVRRGDLPSEETTDPWTTFEMTLREAGPIPPVFDLMRFLASSITFMANVNDVGVFFDEYRIGHVKKSAGVARPVDLPGGLTRSGPSNVMYIKSVHSYSLRIEAAVIHAMNAVWTEKHSSPKISEPCKSMGNFFSSLVSGPTSRPAPHLETPALPPTLKDPAELHKMDMTLSMFTAEVDVNLDRKLSAELLRSTKKKPPAQLKYHLIYTGKDDYDQTFTGDENQSAECRSIFHGFRANLNGATNARIFIGHATGQTTGIGGHMASHFIPTVEREAIDFVDTNIAVWNKELLYVGGFLSRAAYEVELSNIHAAWASAANGTPNFRPSPELHDRLQEQFLHTLKFFTFHHSTPSPEVGQLLEVSFYECSTAPLRLLSSAGVREASDIREYKSAFAEFLKGMPMLPQSVVRECGRTIKTLQDKGMISSVTFSDILYNLRQHRLSKEELVSCLRWSVGLGQDISSVDIAQLLDVTVFNDIDGSIFPLSSIRYFIDSRTLGVHIPLDSPLPTSLLPRDIAKQFTPVELGSFGWQQFTVASWLEYISQPDVISANPAHDFTTSTSWATRVLSTLSHVWSSSSNDAHCLAKKLFANKTCIPTYYGLNTPERSYLPGTSTDLLHDLELPTVQFSDGTKIVGEMETLLSFIGVRKHVGPQLILDRMAKTGNWNITGFVKYLVQVQNFLTEEEVAVLRSSVVFAKENNPDDTIRYRACDLYAPTEVFRQLQLPAIQWDEKSKWSDESDEAKLLFHLGLCRYPPLDKVVELCSSGDTAARTSAFWYLCENLSSKYSNYDPSNFENVEFIPAENDDGNHLGKPGDVFCGPQWKALGFSVVRDDYRKAPTSQLGIQQHPPTSTIISCLEKTPPPNEDAARQWFEILFEQIAAFEPHELVAISRLPIVPTNSSGIRRWLTPKQCYISEGTPDDFHSKLFAFVNFDSNANRFLSACGARNEPTVMEVAESLVSDPKRFHSLAGGHENFLTQLRKLAVNKQRIPNMTLIKMKSGPILLGKKVKDQSAFKSNRYVHELRSPKEIVIADDINAHRLFCDVVFIAPQEELLEDFYLSLGCKRLSVIVQEQCEVRGEVSDTKRCSEVRALVLERLTLFLHEYTHTKPKVSVAWLSDAENFKVKTCEKLSIFKTLVIGNKKTRQPLDVSAAAKRDGQGPIELWLSHDTKPDMYEVSASLCRLLFGTVKVSECLLFTTILSTELEALRRQGWNIDLILKRRQLEQDEPTKDNERRGHVMETSDPSTVPSSPHPTEARVTTPEASKSSTSSQFPHPTHGPQSRVTRPDASKSSVTLTRHYPAQGSSSHVSLLEGSDAIRSTHGTPTLPTHGSKQNYPNRVLGIFPKFSLRARTPRTGRIATASQRTQQHVIPPSIIRANVNMAVKACNPKDDQLLCHLSNMEVVKESLNDRYCDVSGKTDNLKLVGEVPVGGSADGDNQETVKVYAAEDVPNHDTFMLFKQEPLDRFMRTVMPIAEVFNLSMTFLHIFYDSGGGSIAFNKNGSLFLNLRYFEAWHDQDVKNGIRQQAQISWFFAVAHEIAHNLVKSHNSDHAFWFSAICEAHISALMQTLGLVVPG